MCYKVDQVWKNTFSNSCHFWLWSGFSNENITCDTREKYYCVFREKYFLVNCCLRRQEFFVTFSVTFLKTCVYLLLFHLSSIQYNYLVRPFFFLSLMHAYVATINILQIFFCEFSTRFSIFFLKINFEYEFWENMAIFKFFRAPS